LTDQKLSGTTQQSATLMDSVLQLLVEILELLPQFCPIPLDDLINQRA
jgi:hypothetical protein